MMMVNSFSFQSFLSASFYTTKPRPVDRLFLFQGVLQYTVGGDWVQPLPSHGIGPPDDPHPRLTGEWGGVGARQTATAPAHFPHAKSKERKSVRPPHWWTVVSGAKEEEKSIYLNFNWIKSRRLLIRGSRNKEKHKSSNGFFFSLIQEKKKTYSQSAACCWHSNETT